MKSKAESTYFFLKLFTKTYQGSLYVSITNTCTRVISNIYEQLNKLFTNILYFSSLISYDDIFIVKK